MGLDTKKFSKDGVDDTRWAKTFDSNHGDDSFRTVALDREGFVYAVGYCGRMTPESPRLGLWIKKFDTDGNEDTANWDERIDGTGGWDRAYAAKTDRAGNLYVAGFGDNLVSRSSTYDCWIKRFSPHGTEDAVMWNKVFADADNGAPVPYPNQDCIEALAIDSRDNAVVAGFAIDRQYEYSLLKVISSDGRTEWDVVSDSKNPIPSSNTYAVAVDASDSIFIAGDILHRASDRRVLFLKKYVKLD